MTAPGEQRHAEQRHRGHQRHSAAGGGATALSLAQFHISSPLAREGDEQLVSERIYPVGPHVPPVCPSIKALAGNSAIDLHRYALLPLVISLALIGCNVPEEAELDTSNPGISQESPAQEVGEDGDVTAMAKTCRAGPNIGAYCYSNSDCGKYCSAGPKYNQYCNYASDCGKWCSAGPKINQYCSFASDCGKWCAGGPKANQYCNFNSDCQGYICQSATCLSAVCNQASCL